MTPTFDRIDHIHLYATHRDKAEQWYADVLGLGRVPELEEWAVDGGPLTLQNSSGTVHIALFEQPAQPCRSVIALAVGPEEFVAWQRHLIEKLRRPIEAEDLGGESLQIGLLGRIVSKTDANQRSQNQRQQQAD